MTGPCQFCKPHEKQGADRERRRIRRLQRGLLGNLRLALGGFGTPEMAASYVRRLDAATRAPRRRK